MTRKISIKKVDLSDSSLDKGSNGLMANVFISIVFISIFILVIRGAQIQIVSGSSIYQRSELMLTENREYSASRGIFLDRNLNILAKNKESFYLYLINKEYGKDDFSAIREILSSTNVEFNEEEIKEKIVNSKFDIRLSNSLEYNQIKKISESKDSKSYLYYISSQKREYEYPYEFFHVLGYLGSSNKEDVEKGYSQFDQIGRYKLEQSLEDSLRGVKGVEYSVDGVKSYIPSISGANVILNLDKNWQLSLYKILANYSSIYNSSGGAGVVVDNSDGAVLSLVSFPGVDSNLFSSGISIDKYNSLSNDSRYPLIDKAISLQIAPGSTFKLISAYALIESGYVDESTRYFSNRCLNQENFDFCEYQKYFYGDMDVVRALYKSSNLFFCTNALRMQNDNNLDYLFNSQSKFGLGSLTGIDIPGELKGNIDNPEYKRKTFDLGWFSGDTCNAVIGQGSNTVTPIQMALVAQAFANNGVIYKPKVVNRLVNQYGETILQNNSEILNKIDISQKTLDLINSGMYKTANYWDGTVYPFLANVPGNLRVKTGTAEAIATLPDGTIKESTHGWITGTFDKDGKSYSFAFVLYLGGGGFYIGQVARDFIQCVYSNFEGSSCL